MYRMVWNAFSIIQYNPRKSVVILFKSLIVLQQKMTSLTPTYYQRQKGKRWKTRRVDLLSVPRGTYFHPGCLVSISRNFNPSSGRWSK